MVGKNIGVIAAQRMRERCAISSPTELECPMHLQNGVLVQRLTRSLR
jgi:hypothetical protein